MSMLDLSRSPVSLDQLAAAASWSGSPATPPDGIPDVALLTRMANEFFAALPGQSTTYPAGPSLPGFGSSPPGFATGAAPHAAEAATSPLPAGVSPMALAAPEKPGPFDASALHASAIESLAGFASPTAPLNFSAGPSLPGVGVSPAGAGAGASTLASPVSGSRFTATDNAPTAPGVSILDPGAVNGLVSAGNLGLPSNVDAGPSRSGAGVSQSATSPYDFESGAPAAKSGSGLPGAKQSSAPQPPPANPPPQVLSNDHAGLGSPSPARISPAHGTIALPFENELRALLAPLAAEHVASAPGGDAGSSLYFLSGLAGSSSNGIGVPGLAAPGFQTGFASAHPAFDVEAIRRDFPILNETVNGRPLIWFDNAATTQKPKSVIERVRYFYEHENSNIHRAAHELAARATDVYEGARNKVQRFLNAGSVDEIIFTRGTTEAINLVAATFGNQHIGPGDEIVLTNLEHHANIVPWQQLCLAKGAKLRVAPVDDSGALLLDEFGKLLNSRTRLVAFMQVSNALGTITPAKAIIGMAHRVGARVLVDGAQSVSHMKVDVQDLDADFFVFSGHKLFAPTGIGVLYGKKALMDSLPPYQTGGNMIRDVTFERVLFHSSPQRFEAGTGNIADAVGLGAAIDYVERIGLDAIGAYEHKLLMYATHRLQEIPNLRIIGTAPEKASVISFVMKGIPSEEIGARLNKYGIAVRSGHHCAQPILRRFGQETTVRPSFAFYNTCGEIDVLVAALKDIQAETGLTRL